MKRYLTLAMILVLFLLPQVAWAEEWDLEKKPWEKFGANLGVFISSLDSGFRIGSGIGLDVDVEELLGLETTNSAFRADILWRFSKNRRHRLDLSWFAFRRNGDRTIGQDITFEDPDTGEEITIEAGTKVHGFFNFDIFQAAYSYSFFQDDRIDLAVLVGLHVIPIDLGISAAGLLNGEANATFTAPLPTLGLRMDIALTPKWFIRSKTELFYMDYQNFNGRLLKVTGALEYTPWKHLGCGLGFDSLMVNMDAKDESWPGIDLMGSVKFNCTGLQLYLRYFF